MSGHDERDRRARERLRREMHETQVELATLRGEAVGVLRADPELTELLRVQAWQQADPTLALRMEGGRVVGAPDGWPEGVDPEAHVEMFARYRVNRLGKSDQRPDPAEPPASPSVRRLREMTGQ